MLLSYEGRAAYMEEQFMALTNNVKVNAWLDEVIPLLKPDAVELITGEKEQLDRLTPRRFPPANSSPSIRKSSRAAISTAPIPTTWRG